MRKLETVLWSEGGFDSWLADQSERLFTVKTTTAKVTVASVIILGMATVVLHESPFSTQWVNIAAYAALVPVLFLSGHAAHVVVGIAGVFWRLARRPIDIPFFRLPHPAISALANFGLAVSVAVTAAYAIVLVASWQGPYGFSTGMVIWLSVLAFYPLLSFGFTTTQIHHLLLRAKNDHVERINTKVREIEANLSQGRAQEAPHLKTLIEIQERVEKMREWPFAIEGTAILLITVATLITQVVLIAS